MCLDKLREDPIVRKFREDPIVLFTCLLSIATLASVFVAFLQWQTLEKTDTTLRVVERPILYPEQIRIRSMSNGDHVAWGFSQMITNNGSTEAVDFHFILRCKFGDQDGYSNPMASYIGPKQTIVLGECGVDSGVLGGIWQRHEKVMIAGILYYRDLFGTSHWGSSVETWRYKMIRVWGTGNCNTLPIAVSKHRIVQTTNAHINSLQVS